MVGQIPVEQENKGELEPAEHDELPYHKIADHRMRNMIFIIVVYIGLSFLTFARAFRVRRPLLM